MANISQLVAEGETATFEHKGFACTIMMRPDLRYVYQVHGFRESDQKHFLPKVKFDRELTFEQIRDASIAMIDDTFTGKLERYGHVVLYCGEK